MNSIKAQGDEVLVSLTLKGNENAFSELISRYTNMLYSVVCNMISDHFYAEDIVQETFIDGFFQLSRLKEPSKFASWLYGIAKHKALRYITKSKPTQCIDDLAEILYSDNASPENQLLNKENQRQINSAINSLSEKNKTVFIMHYLQNKSVSQIATRLCLSEGTVKSRLYEARNKLKGELQGMNKFTKPSIDLEKTIKEKINKLKNYYFDNGKNADGYDSLLKETESYFATIDDISAKNLAMSSLYMEKYYYKKATRQETFKYAEEAKDGVALSNLYIEDILDHNDAARALEFIDKVAMPKIKSLSSDEGMGNLYLWRGWANSTYHNYEEAMSDFNTAIKLLPLENLYRDVAIAAIKTYENLKENADLESVSLNATAESYRKVGNKLLFKNQPGFSCGSCVMYEKQELGWINYFASRFKDMFYDTDLEIGKTYTDYEKTFTLIGYNDTVTTKAGVFDNCMHINYYDPTNCEADVWYKNGVGLVKISFVKKNFNTEEYELSHYVIKGGSGYFPFAVGNVWRYENPDLPEYLYQYFENEMTWTDGIEGHIAMAHTLAFKKNYMNEYDVDSEVYISKCCIACDSWKIDEAISSLQKAISANTSLNASLAALHGIKYLRRLQNRLDKKYRLCPAAYNTSYLTKSDNKITYDEKIYTFGPYRWGSRFEENRIFGVKPLRYLDRITNCIWNDKWVDGYSETLKNQDGEEYSISVEKCEAIKTNAGTFEDCIKVTLVMEEPGQNGNYYFNDYMYVHCGKKVYYFAKGVGIVKFDFTWGDALSSSSELSSYTNLVGSDSYMPLDLGCEWEYDEMNLTNEGYIAKRTIQILSGINGRFFANDMQEFIYLGTDEEYESFKRNLYSKK
ncbi:MAG: RNA polymerase sigma factor [Clostridia bacterium]|nr:RNA polymerase sigma factor [Clostridia bacterium]